MAYAKHVTNNRRGRGNNGNNRSNNAKSSKARLNQVHESNGPMGRVRGTASQIVEKYIVMARDAATSGDKVLQQSLIQHAEHYQRIVTTCMEDVSNIEERNNQRRQNNKNTKTEDNNSQTELKENSENSVPICVEDSKENNKLTDVPSFLSEPSSLEVEEIEVKKSSKSAVKRTPRKRTVKKQDEETQPSLEIA